MKWAANLFYFLFTAFACASVRFGIFDRKFVQGFLCFSSTLWVSSSCRKIAMKTAPDTKTQSTSFSKKQWATRMYLHHLPPVAPPLSMAFLTFSWSSQRRLENPSMSAVDWAAARCQKQEKWCQCGTFPSNMGDCRVKKEQRTNSIFNGQIITSVALPRH